MLVASTLNFAPPTHAIQSAAHWNSLPRWICLKRDAAQVVLDTAHRTGFWPAARRMIPSGLTVLVYHRIADPNRPDFYGLRDNVSATPNGFAAQLDYLAREYNVISMGDLTALVVEGRKLPQRAVLITFDDGYRDNFTTALPGLVARGMPALMFAVPGFLDGYCFPFWDWVVEAIAAAKVEGVMLPLLEQHIAPDSVARQRQGAEWIDRSKRLPHVELCRALQGLSRVLEVPSTTPPPPGLMMSWGELNAMIQGGVALGAHTATHPILLRVGSARAHREINISRVKLEARVNARITAFAYPNGDFSKEHQEMLADAGYKFGFRVDGGLTTVREIARQPFAIRRTCISLNDDLPRFAAKVAGAERLFRW